MSEQSPYPIFITADGSPTVTRTRADGYGEKMHHSGGALTESLYIYHSALKEALSKGWPIRILSMGLGLGYNELIALAELGDSEFKIDSLELDTELQNGFRLMSERQTDSVFDQVLKVVADHFKIETEKLRDLSRQALAEKKLELRGPFPQGLTGVTNCSVVFYDAFSKKMDEDLWAEDILCKKLGPCLNENCVLSTYAATGSLNRALKKMNFELQERAGFLGKRESTYAIRELSGRKLF